MSESAPRPDGERLVFRSGPQTEPKWQGRPGAQSRSHGRPVTERPVNEPGRRSARSLTSVQIPLAGDDHHEYRLALLSFPDDALRVSICRFTREPAGWRREAGPLFYAAQLDAMIAALETLKARAAKEGSAK